MIREEVEKIIVESYSNLSNINTMMYCCLFRMLVPELDCYEDLESRKYYLFSPTYSMLFNNEKNIIMNSDNIKRSKKYIKLDPIELNLYYIDTLRREYKIHRNRCKVDIINLIQNLMETRTDRVGLNELQNIIKSKI